jgi:hypothetical protein
MPNQVIESNNIPEAIVNYFYKYRSSAKWWSFCLYTSLFGAAVLSAWAGILPQLSSQTKDIATVLAVTASLINTIAGIGRFDQKWQASRVARAATERLHIAMLENQGNQDLPGLGKQLEQIIVNQSAGVVGSHAQPDEGHAVSG